MGIRFTAIHAFLFICISAVTTNVLGQQKPFSQKSVPLTFVFSKDDASTPENHLFIEVAKTLKTAGTPSTTLQLRQNINLYRKESTITVAVEWCDFKFSCDTMYRGMNLKNDLLPSKISCNVFVLNRKTSSSYAFNNLAGVPLNGKVSFIAGTLHEKIKSEYRVDVKDVKPAYTAEQLNAFNKRISMIDNYYATETALDKIIPLANDIRMSDVDDLAEQRSKLTKADSLLNIVEEISFSFSLELEKNDPAGMIPKFRQLREICTSKHNELNHLLTELPRQYYLSAMRSIRLGKTSEARKFLNQSLAIDPMHSASLLQLALFDKSSGKLAEAEEKAKTILLYQKPDSATFAVALSIASQKLQRITNRVSELLQSGKETDALAKLSEAKNFLAEIPVLNGDKVKTLEMQCYRSGYSRMLTNARGCYAQNQFDRSEKLLRDAIQYQKVHIEYIADAGEAENLLHNVLIKRYNLMVLTGKTELFNRHFEKALAVFDEAIDYQVKYKLTANEDAAMLKLRAARSVIKDIIGKSLVASEAKRIGEAKKIAVKAFDTARDRDLMEDSDLAPRLKLLRETVFNKECLMAQNNYNEWHKTGKLAESQKDFLGAHTIYARAQNYFNDYRECSLDAENIEQDQSAINPPYIYQSMLLEVRMLEDKMNYASAVYKYKEAGKYFADQDINSFGLVHRHLADFALDNCSDAFLNYLAKYFVEKGEADKSLLLYKSLIDRKYFIKHPLNSGLYSLGSFIGWRDHLAAQTGKPRLLAQNYFLGEETSNASERTLDDLKRMYRPFIQGFVHGWRKVK